MRYCVVMLWAASLSAAVIGASVAAQPITRDRLAGLPRTQRDAWRDYLARSERQMRADRAFLEAELTAAGLASALVPPGGSAARSMPLNRPAEWYSSDEARR